MPRGTNKNAAFAKRDIRAKGNKLKYERLVNVHSSRELGIPNE